MGSRKSTVERFIAGDPQAFADVVRRHTPAVRSIVARFFRRPFEQEEALQAVWVHLYNKREAVDADRSVEFSGWVATVAKHRCLDLIRARARRPTVQEQPEGPAVDPEGPGRLANEALLAAAAQFGQRLEPEWRDFFTMHFVDGLGYPEICGKLGINKSRCKYMRKVLARRAQKDRALMEALGRRPQGRS